MGIYIYIERHIRYSSICIKTHVDDAAAAAVAAAAAAAAADDQQQCC